MKHRELEFVVAKNALRSAVVDLPHAVEALADDETFFSKGHDLR